MPKYILAVKRGKRADAPTNWLEHVRRIPGVHVEGSASADRAQVEATPEGLAALQQVVGEFCHIEPVITRQRSKPGGPHE